MYNCELCGLFDAKVIRKKVVFRQSFLIRSGIIFVCYQCNRKFKINKIIEIFEDVL